MPAPISYFDPNLISHLGSLRLRAAYVADGLVAGGFNSKRYGSSIEFADHKQYTPGDESRHIDWKLHARTDRYFVRRFEDESNRHFHFVLDGSGSMSFRGQQSPWSKWECAATILVSLATVCLAQGEAVGWDLQNAKQHRWSAASRLSNSILQLTQQLEDFSPEGTSQLWDHLKECSERLQRKSCVIVLSDFLDDLSLTESALSRLLYVGHQVIVLQVLDHDELTFPLTEGGNFRDLEDHTELNLDPLLVRQRYLELLQGHNQTLHQTIQRLNDQRGRCIGYTLDSSDPIAPSLVSALEHRAS